jgi:type II secretory pathway pseudopilin PulG
MLKVPKVREKKRGFTLIEFLIYSVIVSFIVGSLVLTGVNIMQARARINITEEVNHNARAILNMITNHIRQAEGVIYPAPGDSGNYLSLEMPISDFSPTIFEVDENGTLMVRRKDDVASSITSETVIVSDLVFTNLSYTDTPGTVKIVITIEYSNLSERTEYDFEKIFYTTENIRR